ncbi:MAG: sigma-70 family RNA polymerase sigma factor [Nanoarchaeota archaeon]|nr:sigma-70 family RNA polymerase sigma factor [Nanoarchaeota archaeon]
MTESNPYLLTGFTNLKEMYLSSWSFVFRVIFNRVKDRAVAEDLTQHSFVKVLGALNRNMYAPQERKSPEESFRSWLSIIAQNTTFNYLKKRRFEEADYEKMRDYNRSDPEELTIEKEGLEAAIESINSISHTKKRETARLWFIEDKSYQEIKNQLGIPLGSVMSRLNRAKKEMRANYAHK